MRLNAKMWSESAQLNMLIVFGRKCGADMRVLPPGDVPDRKEKHKVVEQKRREKVGLATEGRGHQLCVHYEQ